MSDKRISELTAASSVSGTDVVPIVQSGSTKKSTLQIIADWVIQTASSFTQSGTGAVSTTAQDKLRRTVDLLDFIPTNLHSSIRDGSNTTDLTSYIQAAIDALYTYENSVNSSQGYDQTYRNGGFLKVPKGRYKFTTLDWKAGVVFVGDGEGVSVLDCSETGASTYAITIDDKYRYQFDFPTSSFLGPYYGIQDLHLRTAGASGIKMSGGSANFTALERFAIENTGSESTSIGLLIETQPGATDFQAYFTTIIHPFIKGFNVGIQLKTNDVKVFGGAIYDCEIGVDMAKGAGLHVDTSIQATSGTAKCVRVGATGNVTDSSVTNSRLESSVAGATGVSFEAGNTIDNFLLANNNYEVTNKTSGTSAVTGLIELEGALANLGPTTLKIGASAWTLGANFTATRAAGALEAGAQTLATWTSTYSGDSGGTSSVIGNQFTGTSSGGNALSVVRSISSQIVHGGSAAMSDARGILSDVRATSTGAVTTARAFYSSLALTNSGGMTTAVHFDATAPTLSSTGAITTHYGFRAGNIGHATLVTTAVAFKADDITASATATRGFQSSLSSGTGKHNIYADGTAPNYMKGGLSIGGATIDGTGTQVLTIYTGTAPAGGVADTVQFYSSDDAAGHTIPSFYCEGSNVIATGQADSTSSVRVKMRINGTVVTLLAI